MHFIKAKKFLVSDFSLSHTFFEEGIFFCKNLVFSRALKTTFDKSPAINWSVNRAAFLRWKRLDDRE